jgi:hypothetical protein
MPSSPVPEVDQLAVKGRGLFPSMDATSRWTVTTMALPQVVLQ